MRTAIRPASADALYNRGYVLQSLGRREQALASYDCALAINPGDAEALKESKALLATARKEVKQAFEFQTRRLYEALCVGREWPAAEWEEFLLQHPLMATRYTFITPHCAGDIWYDDARNWVGAQDGAASPRDRPPARLFAAMSGRHTVERHTYDGRSS